MDYPFTLKPGKYNAINYIHFELTSESCNLIGSLQLDFRLNHITIKKCISLIECQISRSDILDISS